MSEKPAVLRGQAKQDIADATAFYVLQAGPTIAQGFIDGVQEAVRTITGFPKIGSTRYAHELNLPGLRSWTLKHYPHVVFYVEREDHIEVWRVLHSQRDIPGWMQEAGDP